MNYLLKSLGKLSTELPPTSQPHLKHLSKGLRRVRFLEVFFYCLSVMCSRDSSEILIALCTIRKKKKNNLNLSLEISVTISTLFCATRSMFFFFF